MIETSSTTATAPKSPQAHIANLLRDAASKNHKILITAHASPDGDALGSMGAMGHILQALGCHFAFYNHSILPQRFTWLPFAVDNTTVTMQNCTSQENVSVADNGALFYNNIEELPFTPDLIITLDCGDAKRVGPVFAEHFTAWPSINIDHHQGNPCFGSVANWVEPTAAATTQMVAELAKELGLSLGGDLGACVYLGLVTDTGSFSFGNTTASTLRLAAEIREAGVNTASITENNENQWSHARFKLWGALMSSLQVYCHGTVAVSIVSDALLAKLGATADDLEGWAGQLRKLRGARVGVMVRSKGQGSKVSMRSSGNDDVRQVAVLYGGGGHLNAAGVEMQEAPHDAAKLIVAALQDKLSLQAD